MRISFKVDDLGAVLKRSYDDGEVAASEAMTEVQAGVKDEFRGQVVGAGMGQRLAETWRGTLYPESRPTINAVAYIWSRTPDIVDAFERGVPRGGHALLVADTSYVRQPARWRRRKSFKPIRTPLTGGRRFVIFANLRRQIEVGGEERRAQFGDEFFHRIAFIANALAPEIAAEASGMARPVRAFMGERGVIAFGVAERLERQHLHMIGRRAVESLIAAVAQS